MRRYFIPPNSLLSHLSNTILRNKGRLLNLKRSYLFLSPLRMPQPPLFPLSAHLVTMCGSANEDFPEWVTISSDCGAAFLGSTKVKDRRGGEGEPITLSLHNTEFSPTPGTLITITLGEFLKKGVSKYLQNSLLPFSPRQHFNQLRLNVTGRQRSFFYDPLNNRELLNRCHFPLWSM